MFKNDIFLLIFHQDPPLSSFGLQKTDPFLYHLIIISSNLIRRLEYNGMNYLWKGGCFKVDQSKNGFNSYPTHYGPYPINPNLIRRYPPQIPKSYGVPPRPLILPSFTTLPLSYWQLLSPTFFGIAGSLFLSLFANDENDLLENFGGNFFKLGLVGYSIGAIIAVSFCISRVVTDPKTHVHSFVYPIGGALASVILLFTSEYLLLYRFFPSSFKGDVGDNLITQFLSFLYFSITTIATANLGDILPDNLTARALIATEIAFNLFTLAIGIQLLLAQKS